MNTTSMTTAMQESMVAMMVDRYVLYPQRVRYFFYICKDRLAGRSRVALVKRLDQLLEVALSQNHAWHSHFSALILEAVEQGALHSTDHDFLHGQLGHCVADRGEKPRETKGRRIGAGLPRR